jgi:hypothetical protein
MMPIVINKASKDTKLAIKPPIAMAMPDTKCGWPFARLQ